MFVANISHELRTPLALILGLTEKVLCSDDAKLWDQDNTKSLETVIDNANILLKVRTIFILFSDRLRKIAFTLHTNICSIFST